jgi:hypothetical protein
MEVLLYIQFIYNNSYIKFGKTGVLGFWGIGKKFYLRKKIYTLDK